MEMFLKGFKFFSLQDLLSQAKFEVALEFFPFEIVGGPFLSKSM